LNAFYFLNERERLSSNRPKRDYDKLEKERKIEEKKILVG
jgi:hypothetical protein